MSDDEDYKTLVRAKILEMREITVCLSQSQLDTDDSAFLKDKTRLYNFE